jgi:predicted lipoprotein with Yx(FWY)xxD motif
MQQASEMNNNEVKNMNLENMEIRYAANENEMPPQSTAIIPGARGEWARVVSKDGRGQVGYRGMELPMPMAIDEYYRMVE